METYLLETIQTEPVTQRAIFKEMLETLEELGKCSANYHLLAKVLFDDDMGDW